MTETVTFKLKDSEAFDDWRYNLVLVAPGKGEAKKTVSRGFIRLSPVPGFLKGTATDDILSVDAYLRVDDSGFDLPVWVTTEGLKNAILLEDTVTLEVSPEFDEKFDELFWEQHVLDSIYMGTPELHGFLSLSPDRLRKFSLLKPQGQPIKWGFFEWADRSIIQWALGDLRGVYVPLG